MACGNQRPHRPQSVPDAMTDEAITSKHYLKADDSRYGEIKLRLIDVRDLPYAP